MSILSEEIERYQKEGEVIIFMDGNGKIGLLGEEKSRNGTLLDNIFENHELIVMNRSEKCDGKIMRQCTTNKEEKSAIDFVVADESIERDITSMVIDEKGLLKLRGEKATDHNTIIVNLRMEGIKKPDPLKRTKWRVNAPEENWKKFRQELRKLEPSVSEIFSQNNILIDQKYNKWVKEIESAAWKSIGKSTVKIKKKEQFSAIVKQLREEKKQKKKELKEYPTSSQAKIDEYITTQNKLKEQILLERTEKTNAQLYKMTQDETRVFFWKERKKIRRNETNECLTIKNNDGKREFNPEILLNVTASFYENLYAKDDFRPHNHHNKVKSDLETFISDHSYDMEWYNAPPTENEIKNIIENKKKLVQYRPEKRTSEEQ